MNKLIILFFIIVSFSANSQTNKELDSLKNVIKELKEDKVKMEKSISEVKERNDGRFEVLTWSAGLLVTFITITLGFNIINSNAKAEAAARDEIDKRTSDLRKEMEKEMTRASELRSQIEDLKLNAETDIQAVITLLASRT